jgi:hypothetical protein
MTFSHLTRYKRPQHFADFAGFDRREYFMGLSQHRDSDTLTRSNFRSMLARLGGESETVLVIRDSHFLVGWVESIYIHESDAAACATANAILDRLADYPVVSEDDWGTLEFDVACEYWQSMRVKERLHYCQKHDISPFAARRDELPEDPAGELVSDLADGL